MAHPDGLGKPPVVSDMRRHRKLRKRHPVRPKAEVVIEFMSLNCVTESVKVIYLPIMVIFCDNRLCETTPHGFWSIFRFRSAPGGHLLYSNASLPRMQVTRLLDRRGYFHRVKPLTKRRAFMGWFARFYDFTKMECALETFEPMTVSDLIVEAKNWKNVSGRMLRKFLARQNASAIFDETMFRQAWEHCSIALPESEWSRVFPLQQ